MTTMCHSLSCRDHITHAFRSLHWHPVFKRIKIQAFTPHVYKARENHLPFYLYYLFLLEPGWGANNVVVSVMVCQSGFGRGSVGVQIPDFCFMKRRNRIILFYQNDEVFLAILSKNNHNSSWLVVDNVFFGRHERAIQNRCLGGT